MTGMQSSIAIVVKHPSDNQMIRQQTRELHSHSSELEKKAGGRN